MIQTYTFISIIGFSLAVVLALVALIMFFALHIKQVRDDLTGKTAARAIAETRARAKTRKRSSTQAAAKYGWAKSGVSSDDLKAVARDDETKTTMLEQGEDETIMLVEGDEGITTILDQDEETETSILSSDDGEAETSNLSAETQKKVK